MKREIEITVKHQGNAYFIEAIVEPGLHAPRCRNPSSPSFSIPPEPPEACIKAVYTDANLLDIQNDIEDIIDMAEQKVREAVWLEPVHRHM